MSALRRSAYNRGCKVRRLPLAIGPCALREGEEPRDMSCLEDKPQQWDRPGKYRCKKCAATADKKKKICKPAKIDKKK